MSECLIYFPGLLGPDVPLAELPANEWPAVTENQSLLELLNNAEVETLAPASVEHQICLALGLLASSEQDVPVATIRNTLSGNMINSAGKLYCLDPVHIQIDQEEAVLLANESLEISESEAQHIIEDLNQHFADDGLNIHFHTPHQWLISGSMELSCSTLNTAMLQNINDHAASGKDAMLWRRWLNEVQMLLHNHPVNQRREEQGQGTINSVWIWGGGLQVENERVMDKIISDHAMLEMFARYCDVPYKQYSAEALPVFDRPMTLIALLNSLGPVRNKDVYQWFDTLHELDKTLLTPLMKMLHQGELDTLTLFCDRYSFTLNRSELKRRRFYFWKKKNNLRDRILKLRMVYAD